MKNKTQEHFDARNLKKEHSVEALDERQNPYNISNHKVM